VISGLRLRLLHWVVAMEIGEGVSASFLVLAPAAVAAFAIMAAASVIPAPARF
jgi:hypothetical protein